MALTNIEMIRSITQDNGRLPFLDEGEYILSDDELEAYLSLNNNDLMQSARMALRSICQFISTVSTKELYGDVEVWSEASKNYLKAAQAFLDDKTMVSVVPKGLIPYAAGTSVQDILASLNDPDNPRQYDWLYTRNFNPMLEGVDSGKWSL